MIEKGHFMRLGGTRRDLKYCKIHIIGNFLRNKKNRYVAKCDSRKLYNGGKLGEIEKGRDNAVKWKIP